MTDRVDNRSGARPAFLLAAIAAAVSTLTACMGSRPSPSPHVVGANGEIQGVGRNTGTFPNLNVPPQVAAEQLTPEQKQAKLGQLDAEKRSQAAEGAKARATVDAAQLKKLGETHAQDALKSIEGN
ncbi:MAG TPA: hypothetical protein VNS34_16645 [Rhizobiaceae bacterium]|nr:hypothetical protein [Rhizobiaceae bacterium]